MKWHFCAVWWQAEKSKVLVGRIRVNLIYCVICIVCLGMVTFSCRFENDTFGTVIIRCPSIDEFIPCDIEWLYI